MSAFTDDDLKRLKEDLTKPSPHMDWVQNHVVQALLARLEAAELTIEHLAPYLPRLSIVDCATYKAWRKAAGK